jgi:hypothetical protein
MPERLRFRVKRIADWQSSYFRAGDMAFHTRVWAGSGNSERSKGTVVRESMAVKAQALTT